MEIFVCAVGNISVMLKVYWETVKGGLIFNGLEWNFGAFKKFFEEMKTRLSFKKILTEHFLNRTSKSSEAKLVSDLKQYLHHDDK